jgi:acyl-CoA reductase-like NAD-dependent aldehyde dehydrogenase
VNTNNKMKVVREEIFGPVVTAISFKDVDDLVARANDTPYVLAAAVWTRDISKAHRIASQLRAGSLDQLLWHPRCHLAGTNSPAGAAKWDVTRLSFTRRSNRSARQYRSVFLSLSRGRNPAGL